MSRSQTASSPQHQYAPIAICTAKAVKRKVTAALPSEARWIVDWTTRHDNARLSV